jgi:LmbE family N-acetylglucosaminyl deacetylase
MGASRTILVIVAHADDAAGFCGGAIATWADRGDRVVLVRGGNDENDSIGLGRAETKEVNARELRAAAAILGIEEVIDLDYPDGTLGDIPGAVLRARLITIFRRVRPYVVVTFDPYGVLYENNQDHLAIGKAVDEAFWAAACDKYNPEELAEGLELHGAVERWYFARRLLEATEAVDIGPVFERKVDALLAHEAMMRDTMLHFQLQVQTAGMRVPMLDDSDGHALRRFVGYVTRKDAQETGKRHAIELAEEFRVVRFGGLYGSLEDLFVSDSE